jgi:hypothetical protein
VIWVLRNIGVHLWLTALFATPLSFYLLPKVTTYFPGIEPLIISVLTITCVAVVFSVVMDLTARRIVTGLIKKGVAWERSGISNRAEQNYIKALRVYDTFLLWPFSAKKIAKKISGAIAKFNLNSQDFDSFEVNSSFSLSILVYLKMNSEDEDMARLWLSRLRKATIVTSFEQEILSILAKKYYGDKIISILILDIFLGLERKDFTARKLYLQVLKNSVLKDKYAAKIEALIGREKETETLQQQVFYQLPRKKTAKKFNILKVIRLITQKSLYGLSRLYTLMGSFLGFLISSVVKAYIFIKEHEKTLFYLKAGSLLIVTAALLFFMNNTVAHIFKSRSIENEKIVPTPIHVSRPFTIQVAAYLKKKYAERYVDILIKKRIDARIKAVNGGGKTWFVVRVSEFADKKSAAAYGQKLKKQEIIDDFFVNNK